jgi:DNA (cytosine-5)-methyltransferase 1
LKVLNLYSGIGGNRKLWDNVEVTAVEINEDIAKVYQDLYPQDTVMVGDAHEYLIKNYKEYEFIWSSPPCPSHSDIRRCGVHRGQNDAIYPEMELYQEIILLKHFAKGKWVIENVKPYYKPLIPPDVELHRHYFWSNFWIRNINVNDERKHQDIQGTSTVYGINLNDYEINDKRKLLRNMVNPEVAKYILDCAREYTPPIQEGLFGTDS